MKRPSDFTTKLGGRTWTVRYVRRTHPKVRGCWGHCFWEEREIYVRYDMSQQRVLDTTIHEMLHATCHLLFVAEEWVTQTATEIADGLKKAGL